MQGALRDHLGKGRVEVRWAEGDVELQCGPDGGLSNTQGARVLQRPFRVR